jgi:MoaD family protein
VNGVQLAVAVGKGEFVFERILVPLDGPRNVEDTLPQNAAECGPSAAVGLHGGTIMKVKVQYMGQVRVIVNRKDEEIEVSSQATIRELMHILSNLYGKEFDSEVFQEDGETPRDDLIVAVNGIGIAQLNLTKTSLKQGDTVTLFPVFPGGG